MPGTSFFSCALVRLFALCPDHTFCRVQVFCLLSRHMFFFCFESWFLLRVMNYFCKILHLRYLAAFWVCLSIISSKFLTFGKNLAIAMLICISYKVRYDEHCMKLSVSGVFLVRIFRIQSECGKIWIRKTPNTDTFYAVESIKNIKERKFWIVFKRGLGWKQVSCRIFVD